MNKTKVYVLVFAYSSPNKILFKFNIREVPVYEGKAMLTPQNSIA